MIRFTFFNGSVLVLAADCAASRDRWVHAALLTLGSFAHKHAPSADLIALTDLESRPRAKAAAGPKGEGESYSEELLTQVTAQHKRVWEQLGLPDTGVTSREQLPKDTAALQASSGASTQHDRAPDAASGARAAHSEGASGRQAALLADAEAALAQSQSLLGKSGAVRNVAAARASTDAAASAPDAQVQAGGRVSMGSLSSKPAQSPADK